MLRHTALQVEKLGLRTYKATSCNMTRHPAIPHDVQDFLQGYPDNEDVNENARIHLNLDFYSNKIKSRPDNLIIEDMLNRQVPYLELCVRVSGRGR